MYKIRIVIVDDHEMFLQGISAVLSKQDNFEVVHVFNNAKDAIKAIKIETPDLLITDISMPEINGLEFIKEANLQHPKLKILVVSMFKQIQSFDGIHGYLLKETSYEELIIAINKIVLHDEKYFYKVYHKDNGSLEFNKSILSTREKEIVALIAKELTTEVIAEKLFLSKHTVETHKKNIYLKLQVNNAAGLIKKAVYLGYIS